MLTRVFVRDTRIRRSLMFYIALAAILMVFAGSVVLDHLLREHPLLFLGYWGICAWLTIAVILLALLDIFAVRAALRAERRHLERKLLSENDNEPR